MRKPELGIQPLGRLVHLEYRGRESFSWLGRVKGMDNERKLRLVVGHQEEGGGRGKIEMGVNSLL